MPSSSSIITPTVRSRLLVSGIVQGVGFRPTVYRLARSMELSGWVRNDGHGVTIEIQGEPHVVSAFAHVLRQKAPAASSIHGIDVIDIEPVGIEPLGNEPAFVIDVSARDTPADTMISPDLATCPDCLAELQDPGDRRFGYAFLNCTNCGPRYTIVGRIPYDRPHTSMTSFVQCPACQAEYDDPADRRFHAQPNACGECGPRLSVVEGGRLLESDDPLRHAQAALAAGRIVAIRGIGGFHLAVDPTHPEAVERLRQRKRRTDKPFALMARDLETVARFVHISTDEAALLQGPERPIVLLERRGGKDPLAETLAPGQSTLGFMLPYAPLHHLLLSGPFQVLVMTSANVAEEPIITSAVRDQKPIALKYESATFVDNLGRLADLTLTHDREILQRCDDSVVRLGPKGPVLLRRSRGHVPSPIRLSHDVPIPTLAVGGHLKNTVALARGRDVVMSQHIGDLDNPAALGFFEETIDHLCGILQVQPERVVCDLHPDYLSTRWARASGYPVVAIQHHHAHFAGVLAEHGRTEPALGLIMDGTGYGTDGTIWGGEVLVGTPASSQRVAHLQLMALPGGDKAIREPWRLGASLLRRTLGPEWTRLPLPSLLTFREPGELALIDRMMERGVNTPLTSSAGRLFDGIAALLGIRERITYEAQAAVELETLARRGRPVPWLHPDSPAIDQDGTISTDDLVQFVLSDLQSGVPTQDVAARFHATMAHRLASVAGRIASDTGLETCVLSGGVFQNTLLLDLMVRNLEIIGLKVLLPSRVPPNDGGLAFGQIAAVAALLTKTPT